MPPITIGTTAKPGMSMPSPIAVGDGTKRPKRGLTRAPSARPRSTSATTSATSALDGERAEALREQLREARPTSR